MTRAETFDAPAGRLAELPVRGAAFVLCFRLWCEGPESQTRVWNALARTFGPAAARGHLRVFEEFVTLVVRAAPRPLKRRHAHCPYLTPDEQRLGLLVAGTSGRHAETTAPSALLPGHADEGSSLAALAERVGLALAQVALPRDEASPVSHASTQTRH